MSRLSCPRFRRQKGFVLLELILALSVVSVSLLVLMQAFSLIAYSQTAVFRHTQAYYLLHRKMHELRKEDRSVFSREDTFDPPFERYRWKARLEPEKGEDLRKAELTVLWDGERGTHSVSAVTFLRGDG